MNSLSFLNSISEKRILIAPLNWGLGHATRCIPIINKLKSHNSITLGSDGIALKLLKAEFPELPFVELPAYNIEYKSNSFLLSMLKQSPKITMRISEEMAITEELINEFEFDMIISDHRLGCRDKRVKSVIIAHQLQIKSGNSLAAIIGGRFNRYFINLFDECWIPDFSHKEMSLSGELSITDGIKRSKYIGPLSRLSWHKTQHKYDVAIILSGPEPARTELEKLLLKFVDITSYKVALIRGAEGQISRDMTGTTVIDLAGTKKINQILNMSKLIITRSGYSTIMDLVQLRKKAILIPTPGQTEQEYLAKHLNNYNNFTFIDQTDLTKERIEELVSSTIC